MLGGQNEIVEIDESMFSKVKHFRGKDMHLMSKRRQLWVFGMKKVVLNVVQARNAATLLKIIYDHVRPGSVIHSDLLKAYYHIDQFKTKQFKHRTVNHTLYFVHPETGVHINGIESSWRVAKKKIKKMCGIKRGYIQPYLDEFMWRQNNSLEYPLLLLINSINKIYPLGSNAQ
jgi:transposase-like protein